MGPYVLVLASAVNDSAYVAILDSNFHLLAQRGFNSPMNAMLREGGALVVTGQNPYGYDIHILPLHRLDFDKFANGPIRSHHYRVAKQSEKIKSSDPVGIGLTAVAVAVVFLALVCISLIISGSGKLMSGMGDKKKSDKKKTIKPVSDGSSAINDQEVYAAIAAAIHLYNDELHDEEETVITIQKVEREWTPWNAKFYNMNQYFNNRK
jgi:Na+-transporting methylmalonyl-CoA/oxaloacetate decarboxylase gamma subunit